MVLLLAASCGLAVANLYYAQPLLHTIAKDFGTSSGTAGLVVTLSQVGYAIGLALIVPLGDLLDRRRLVPGILVGTAGATVAAALAPGIAVLIAVALLIGLGSVAAQLLVPLAAELASDDERGGVVGQVMSGLLLGILLARTVAGLVAGAAGWRAVYWMAAVVALVLALVLSRSLPADGQRPRRSYAELLRTTARLFLDEPVLRRRAAFGALGFAAFSVFWTTVAFELSGPHYGYSDSVIGLFGLVGAAGALCAGVAGRLADQGRSGVSTVAFASSIMVSFLPLWLGRTSVVWLVVGILLLDIGVQGLQVTNQSVIYGLPVARSGVNSVYMVCYFTGGAIGSAVAGSLYDVGGWSAICWLGAALGALVMLGSLSGLRAPSASVLAG